MKFKILIALAMISTASYANFIPCCADYDGDGLLDPAVYHQDKGCWEILLSSRGYSTRLIQYGLVGAIPIVGDFDKDGLVDFACVIPDAGIWAILLSSTDDVVMFSFGNDEW